MQCPPATVTERMGETMSKTRAARAEAQEEWAEQVEPADLKIADTDALRAIAELAERRSEIDDELTAAIREARKANRSWSEIGAMLGVSKQAAQRKYAATAS
jgi:predicted ATP-dependent protease